VNIRTAAQVDDILIKTIGFDVGGKDFSNGKPTTPAKVIWEQAWFGSYYTFEGTIHFDGVTGSCARIQLISYDDNSVEMGTRRYSDVQCVYTNGHVAKDVVVEGEAGAVEVKVRLQTQAVDGSWHGVGSELATYGPHIGDSELTISAAQFDVGNGTLSGGAPTEPALVSWDVKAGSSISVPVLTGKLFIKNANYLCARVRYEYKDINDNLIETRNGVTHCVDNNRLHTYSLNANDYSDNTAINKLTATIEVSLNTNGQSSGVWSDVSAQSTTMPTVPVTDVLNTSALNQPQF
jgi:hypothetical protein